ncbi:MAG: NAD(P)H-hydrate epimerase [Planctomycetes bacterium]|nr:NAD(P)H-hydrate epimerase [Planctomycetota bacterium]
MVETPLFVVVYDDRAMQALTREQIREIDRCAIEEYGIAGIVLMENAGRNAAELIRANLKETDQPAAVCILCGRGNNGGDGFVIARHLFNAGLKVEIILFADPEKLAPDARVNHDIAHKMKIPIRAFTESDAAACVSRAQVVIDALLGTGFSGKVRPPLDRAIELINSADHALKVAIDVPSGLDCNTGQPAAATVRADLTITFVAPKTGFASAAEYTGQVLTADIGAPRTLFNARNKKRV